MGVEVWGFGLGVGMGLYGVVITNGHSLEVAGEGRGLGCECVVRLVGGNF